MMSIQPFVLAALGAAVFSAVAFLLTKHLLKNLLKDAFVFIFYHNLFSGSLGVLLWVIVGLSLPDRSTMGIVFAISLLAFVGFLFNYVAFEKGDISTTGPLMGLKIPFVALCSFLIMGERHEGLVYVGVLLSMVSIALLSWEDRSQARSRPALGAAVLLMTLATVLYAIADTFVMVVLTRMGSFHFTSYFLIFQALFSWFVYPFIRNRPAMKLTLRVSGYFVVLACLTMASSMLFFLSIKTGGNVTIPNILLSSRGVLVVLATFGLAHLAKNPMLESQSRHTYAVRLVGAAMMSVAVALVVGIVH
ncbi:MAG: EamA family transporter [Candidatus Latescibacterota bacterium]